MRIYQLQTTWKDGNDMGGVSFYFKVEPHVRKGEELQMIKQAAKDFLMTDEGKKINKSNCNGNFGWGDIFEIPHEMFNRYGLYHHEGPKVFHSDTVEHDVPILF
ncbi:hypothetical protein [Halalkalibacter akibai]|uniref:Uncharacterized protein n=1 Tax=Halalkalibacter akibai (strain ATCC 43226 / DSM 21942 / CIP 109018 / JCM 9157 / 1139) TaxID=1236973 RepID=W4QWA3_HALA3|nr:hypothetical protein [Halalkalibacter akibai]GAE35599.1 hypothetical protein JCM9157_2713 [Halalkalibacter akibai JCM 9157]